MNAHIHRGSKQSLVYLCVSLTQNCHRHDPLISDLVGTLRITNTMIDTVAARSPQWAYFCVWVLLTSTALEEVLHLGSRPSGLRSASNPPRRLPVPHIFRLCLTLMIKNVTRPVRNCFDSSSAILDTH